MEAPPPKLQVMIYRIFHRNQFRLGLFFPVNDKIKAVCKAQNCTYSRTHKCWYADDSNERLKQISTALRGVAFVDYRQMQMNCHVTKAILYRRRAILMWP